MRRILSLLKLKKLKTTNKRIDRETFTEFDEHGWPTAATFDSEIRYMNYQGDEKGCVTYSYSGIDHAGNWTKNVKKVSYTEKGYEIFG